jgi:Lon protease-like protein
MAGACAPPGTRDGSIAIDRLPLFPLNTVLFPGGHLPLRIFEKRYMDMASACLRGPSPFGVCLIREGTEVGAPATPHEVGTLAKIVEWDMEQLGVLQIVARGEQRFRVLERHVEADGLINASIELLADDENAARPDANDACVALLKRAIAEHPALIEPPHRLDSSAWVGARLTELLPLPLEIKQQLLEADGPERLQRLNAFLTEDN